MAVGEAIAYGLAMHGARVVIGGRDGAKANALAKKIHQASGTSAVALDVRDVSTSPGLIDRVVDRFGRPAPFHQCLTRSKLLNPLAGSSEISCRDADRTAQKSQSVMWPPAQAFP